MIFDDEPVPGFSLPILPGHSSPGRLERVLRAGKFAVTTEISPPDSANPNDVYSRARVFDGYVDAMNALEKTVRHNPDHALAMAALGDLVATTYMFGYEEDESLLARAEALGRNALALDPNCQVVHWTMAFIHFLKYQRSLFLEEVKKCLQLNPNNA